MTEQPAQPARAVTVVAGPPCAGKTWYVEHHARPGDLVVCLDTLARQAGSDRQHNHRPEHYAAAQRRYDQLVAHVAQAPAIRAWVIRCAASPTQRAELAAAARATRTLVLLPPMGLALRRARARDNNHDLTERVIRRWYRAWQPTDTDEVQAGTPPTW